MPGRSTIAILILFLLTPTLSQMARAHDLPASLRITGYFDDNAVQPQLIMRIPLIMLTNVNLPKRGAGYLDLGNLEAGMARAESAVTDGFEIWTEGQPLQPAGATSRISAPSDDAFDDLDAARAHIAAPPLAIDRNIYWNQGYFDIRLTYPRQAPGQSYTLRTGLPHAMAERTIITLGLRTEGGAERTLTMSGATEAIALDPVWYQAGALFLHKGVEHILTGWDHLLFLICLIMPLRREPRRLLIVVTAFTIGHSVTLIPAALGMVPRAGWFAPGVEALIAASIVVMAVDNVLGSGARFRWALAFGFGLIHGFGFAGSLAGQLQFAGAHLVSSLVFFNIGIEFGQVVVLAVVLTALAPLLTTARRARYGTILISVLAGHQAWHWMIARLADLQLVPGLAEQTVMLASWAGLALIVLLAIWAGLQRYRRSGRIEADPTKRA